MKEKGEQCKQRTERAGQTVRPVAGEKPGCEQCRPWKEAATVWSALPRDGDMDQAGGSGDAEHGVVWGQGLNLSPHRRQLDSLPPVSPTLIPTGHCETSSLKP